MDTGSKGVLRGRTASFVEWRRGPGGLRRALLAVLLLGVCIGAVGALVYYTGGTAYTWPYLMILPILLAAALFQIPGGLLAALAGGLVLGPFMPLEVNQAMTQSTHNWLLRLAMLSGIGFFAGLLFQVVASQVARLQQYARGNPDTGLPNQVALQEALQQMMLADNGNTEKGVRSYLFAVHINNYGSISAMLGQINTTQLIRSVAQQLNQYAGARGKTFQTATDQLIVMLHSTRRKLVRDVREIIHITQGPHDIQGELVHVDSHLGAAAYPFHEADDPVLLIRKVISAMFIAREQDRAYATYDQRLDEVNKRQTTLLGRLRPAIANNELVLHYQPKLELATGRIVGVEALVRWPQPDGSLTPPGDFIPSAEQSGLIHPLTRWVMRTALKQQALWKKQGLNIAMAVNVSPRNFGDEEFTGFVQNLIGPFNLSPGDLELEITENALMRNPNQVAGTVNELAALGIIFSIDDFGTGYSSLAYLEQLKVSVLKIDQTFIRQLQGAGNAPIVRGSILMAHSLGLSVVAEGIETQQAAEALKEMECDYGQGYYYCRPQSSEDLEPWLRKGTLS